MPPTLAYSVSFRNGNLSPKGGSRWGDMVPGGTSTMVGANQSDSKGLYLVLNRADTLPPNTQESTSLYVVPGRPFPPLLIESRLLLRVRFDLPQASSNYPDRTAEPWALCLRIKLGNPIDSTDPFADPQINVTCQWNNEPPGGRSGPRLNSPQAEQKDQAADLDPPLDYLRYRPGCLLFHDPTQFIMDFSFCGKQALPGTAGPDEPPRLGYAVGCGRLTIGDKEDQRVFSHTGLSRTPGATEIGALGISLASISGAGTSSVRLRDFWIWMWDE